MIVRKTCRTGAASPRDLRGWLYAALVTPAILVAVQGGKAEAGQLPASAFQTYTVANASGITPGPLALYAVPVDSLHPTQLNKGLTEVGKKTTGFDLLAPSQLQANLLTDVEPVVIGPGGQLYLTDGHHTFTALENSIYGASNPTVYVDVVANFSNLTTAQFFAAMQAGNLLLPINDGVAQTVNTATGAPIPSALTGLTSDPYRGLEYSILKNKSAKLFTTASNLTGAIGASTPGLDKMTGFYEDFFEADAYRGANGGKGLPYLSPGDIALATQWNLNAASTTTLPNVSGTVTAAQLPGFILGQNIVNSGGITNATLASGAMDGNGGFTGLTSLNAGTAASPVTIGAPNTGFVLQLGADRGFAVTLNGANSYTGGTSLLAGTLIVQSDASLGAAPTGAAIDPNNVKTSVQAANGIVFNSLDEGAATLTLGTTTGGTFATNRAIAVGGEAATINVNDNTVTLGGSIYSLGVGPGGVGTGNATGFSDLTIDDLSSADAGKVILSQASPNFYGNLIIGNTGAPTVEVMNDAALGATTGSVNQIGQIELNSGTLQAGASFAAPERNIFLQSGSQIDVNGFNTTWGSITDVQRSLEIENTNTTTAGSITFSGLAIGATAILQMAGGPAGETATFTNGVSRMGNDTLVIQPSSSTSLGNTEKVFSGGSSAALTNGIAPVWVVTNNGVAKGAGPYDFVTYGANGYVKATYTSTATLNTGTASQVVALSGASTLTGNAAVYALNTEGKTIALGGHTLTVGDGVNPAGLILASGSQINNGTLAFGASEGVIWLSGSNPNIAAAITGANGLTFAGSGSVALSTAATVSGPITIDAGTVTLSGANIFASNVGGILLDDVKKNPAPATLAISANNSLTALNSVGSNSAVNISGGAVLTLGDTVNNLSSTLSATVKETGAATAGALTFHGSGLFDLSAGSINLVSGSTVVVDDSARLRVAVGALANSNFGFVLNGTSELQFAQNGGGKFSSTVSGTGALHLIGGTLQLTGTNNSYSGGTVVETGSTLDLTTANVSSGNANITAAGGLIVFDQAVDGTYAGVISDGKQMGVGPLLSGSLDKDDSTGANAGNLTLAQAQTYTGQTTVEAGTLTLAAVDTLATSSGVDLGRVGGGSTASLVLGANNTIQALTSEAGDTTSVVLGANTLTLNTPTGVSANFGGTISGAGGLVKMGAGVEILSGATTSGSATVNEGMLVLSGGALTTPNLTVNGGAFDIVSGQASATTTTVTGGMVLVSGGQLSSTNVSMTGGSLLVMGGGLSATNLNIGSGALLLAGAPGAVSVSNVTNAGVLDLRNGAGTNVLKVAAYTGAPGSQLALGVNFATGTADKLVATTVSGSSKIVLTDVAPNVPGTYNPAGIVLISSPNAINPANFTLANGPVQKGLFVYSLAYDPDPAIVLVSTPAADAYRLAALPTAGQSVFFDTAALWADHQSDMRDLILDGPSGQPAEGAGGIWARAEGNWTNRSQNQTVTAFNNSFSYQTGYSLDTTAMFVGADGGKQSVLIPGDTVLVGINAGYINANQAFKSLPTRATYEGGSIGLTASYLDRGVFVDGAVKVDFLHLNLSMPSVAGFSGNQGNGTADTLGGYLNTGYRFTLANLYIQPSAGLAYADTRIDDLTLAGATVSFPKSDTLRGRLGLTGGGALADAGGYHLNASVNASYWSRLTGGSTAAINDGPGAPLLSIEDPQVRNFGEVGLSFTAFNARNGLSGFLDLSDQFGSSFNAGSVRGGLRYAF